MKKVPFYSKYVRSFFLRSRPVVCHFFATERCNLVCPYCTVYKNPRKEADLETVKRMIDKIAKMGVANFSITGGEPLVRKDIFDIINYASTKIPYVRVTSNGTVPLKLYQQLLKTSIDGISISVDAVNSTDPGHDKHLNNSFDVVDYLYKNRGRRKMNISTTFHGKNEKQLSELIKFCDEHWPGLNIFIQPTVVGKGALRAEGERLDPDILFSLSRARNVSNTDFFNDICRDYYMDPDFEFKCLAGRLFFGVRPNGEYWACHDVPTGLNILDDDFDSKFKKLDFGRIADPKKCGSCIYSCYINLQKGFESMSLRNLVSNLNVFGRQFGSK